MKQKVITSVIKKRFNNIKNYIKVMLLEFEEEAVHDFRTEIKKLRAFLRLLNTGNNNQLNITKSLKVYYWYAGEIRNLQLHMKSISDMEVEKPLTYLERTSKQIESLQGALRSLHSPSNFDRPKKIIGNRLTNLEKPSVKKFVADKVDELNNFLLLIKQDEILHAIRKLLKDLLYNWKNIKPYRSFLPIPISAKKQITKLTDILGEFCDRNVGMHLLETSQLANPNSSDKYMLQKIREKWDVEKNELRLKIYSMLNYNPA